MESPAPVPQSNSQPETGAVPQLTTQPPQKAKRWWLIGAGLLVLAVVAVVIINRTESKNVAAPPKKPEPAFHRDEPTEPQIFQNDYKQKVGELLDSGKSVHEVSKETHIRVDEVRKIKHQRKKEANNN